MFKRLYRGLKAHLELFYLLTFALYLASVTVLTTTFYVHYPHRVAVLIQLITVGLLLIKIVGFDHLTTRQIVAEVGLVTLVTIVMLISSAHFLLPTVLLVLGARGVRFRKIVTTYLIVVGTILLIALIASLLGVIENITFATDDGLRQSFGVVYTTDFAAHVFYLCAAYLYLIARRFRLFAMLPVILALVGIYVFTSTLTDTIALAVLIVSYLLYIYRRQLSRLRVLLVGLRLHFLALPVISALIIWLTANFDYNDRFMRVLNDALSTRLSLGKNAFLAYGVKFFGQAWIPVNGWGGDRSEMFTNGVGGMTYFFIDSSFVNMLVAYGFVLTVVIILGLTVFLFVRTRQRDYLLPTIFFAVAIASAFDQHFLEVTYNVFILAVLAGLPSYETRVPSLFHRSKLVYRLRYDQRTHGQH